MPEPVERYDPDGIDYAWIMQMTFVLTIVFGAPLVAGLSWWISLPTTYGRVRFALATGALLWFCIALGLFAYVAITRT